MAVEIRNIVPGTNLGIAAASLYTAGAGERVTVTAATVINHAASTATCNFWILPSGVGATADRYLVLEDKGIPVGLTYTLPELRGQTLNPGDSLWGIASAATTLATRINAQVVT